MKIIGAETKKYTDSQHNKCLIIAHPFLLWLVAEEILVPAQGVKTTIDTVP